MNMTQAIKWKPLLLSLAIPLAVGGFSAFLTRDGMRAFASLPQPPLSPPGWVFAFVWTLLYLLLGLACYLVWTAGVSERRRDRALTVYGLSLGCNFLWPIVFFTVRAWLAALLLLVLLWILGAICLLLFSCIDKRAGKLLIPYMAWLSFAAYLNFGVWILNR